MKKRIPTMVFVVILSLTACAILLLNYATNNVTEKIVTKMINSDADIKAKIDEISDLYNSNTDTQSIIAEISENFRNDDKTKSFLPSNKKDISESSGNEANQEEIQDDTSTSDSENTSSSSTSVQAKSFWDEPLVKSVYSRFSASEIAQASAMAAGGFTSEEKAAIKSMVYGRVSGSEIQEIQRLYYLHNKK